MIDFFLSRSATRGKPFHCQIGAILYWTDYIFKRNANSETPSLTLPKENITQDSNSMNNLNIISTDVCSHGIDYNLYSKIGYNNLFSESVITLTILRSSRQAGRQTGRQTNGRTDKFTQNEHGIRSRFKILTFDSPEFACVWNVWFVEQLRNNVWVFMYIEFIEFISNVKAS